MCKYHIYIYIYEWFINIFFKRHYSIYTCLSLRFYFRVHYSGTLYALRAYNELGRHTPCATFVTFDIYSYLMFA